MDINDSIKNYFKSKHVMQTRSGNEFNISNSKSPLKIYTSGKRKRKIRKSRKKLSQSFKYKT